jgi:penicillin amidase
MAALQKDVAAWNAERLVPLLSHVERVAQSEALARARSDLLGWDRRMSADSTAASLYARWESALRRLLIEHRIPPPLRDDFSTRRWSTVPILEHPTRAWFDGDPVAGRDGLLVDALAAAVQERTSASSTAWGAEHQVAFVHPLAITDAARRRFNVGPFALPGYADTVFAATTAIGPALRMIVDVGEWDRSVVANAPGQSESPGSTHFSDLARLWAAGDYAPMPFSEAAVRSNAAATLVLTPLH